MSAEYLTEKAQQHESVAWPCVIAEADFEQDTITLEMQCSDYKVGAGQHWLSTSPPAIKPWVGLTDEDVTLSHPYSVTRDKGCFHAGADWANAKLKEKNNG